MRCCLVSPAPACASRRESALLDRKLHAVDCISSSTLCMIFAGAGDSARAQEAGAGFVRPPLRPKPLPAAVFAWIELGYTPGTATIGADIDACEVLIRPRPAPDLHLRTPPMHRSGTRSHDHGLRRHRPDRDHFAGVARIGVIVPPRRERAGGAGSCKGDAA